MARSGSASGAERRARVTALDADGRGRGVLEGGGSFSVPGALPGELVRIGIAHVDRRGHSFGVLREVIEASPERIEPACKQFLICGGCDLLHAPLATQHAFKRRLVAEALQLPIERVDPVVSSPRELGYRALAKLVVEGTTLGSYAPRSHDVVDMAGCAVHAPEVEVIADAIRAELPVPELRYVLIRASLLEKRALVIFVVRRKDASLALARKMSARADISGIYEHVNDSPGDELLSFSGEIRPIFEQNSPEILERVGDFLYRVRPGAFAQVNPGAAGELYDRAVALAEPEGAQILDLYSGSGGLAIALAKRGAARVVAVEEIGSAVEAARESARENQVELEVRLSSAEQISAEEKFDVVMLNPPRKGASPGVLAAIERIAPARIIYVSCNPETLARDVRALPSYQLDRVIPVDLFPGTRHVETIVRLRGR